MTIAITISQQVVGLVGRRAERGGAIVADPRDDVDGFDEDLRGLVRHPVARGVADGVAGRAAHSEELRLGLGVITDAGEVLVATARGSQGRFRCGMRTAKDRPGGLKIP